MRTTRFFFLRALAVPGILILSPLIGACSQKAAPVSTSTAFPITPTAAVKPNLTTPFPSETVILPTDIPSTSEPSATPESTQTPVPTPTITPQPNLVTTQRQALVFGGPGDPYPWLVTYAAGITFPVMAKSYDGAWFIIALNASQTGWISSLDVTVQADLNSLSVVTPDPAQIATPTVPSVKAHFNVSVKVTYLNSGPNLITISLSGMTPGVHYDIEVINPKGKRIKHSGLNGTPGGTDGDCLEPDGLIAGVYTVIVTASDGQTVQTHFTIEKNK